MAKLKSRPPEVARLRERAEASLGTQPDKHRGLLPEDLPKLVRELRAHQIELEIQNKELRRVQVELVESRDRYSDLYASAPVGYFTFDAKGLITEVNLAGAEMLEDERRALIGNSFSRFVDPGFKDAFFLHCKQVLEARASQTIELRLKTSHETPLYVQLSTTRVEDSTGDVDQIRTALTDISQRKQAEETLRKARDELERRVERRTAELAASNANLRRKTAARAETERRQEKLLAKLEAQNTALEQFSRKVSHDLKGPLITIQAFLALLRQDMSLDDAEVLEEKEASLVAAVTKMERLVDVLAEWSWIGQRVDTLSEVSLAELASQAVELIVEQIPRKRVRFEISPDLPVVFGARRWMLQILRNLIENAGKFTGDQPRPRVEVGRRFEGEEVVCFVRDNGMGIEPRHHARIFGLFSQLDPKVEGLGVGLALAKRIIEAHEGRMWVESEGLGQGSTFCFTVRPVAGAPHQEQSMSTG